MSKKLSNETYYNYESMGEWWIEFCQTMGFFMKWGVIVCLFLFILWFLFFPSSSVVSDKDVRPNTTALSPQTQLSETKEIIQIGDTIYLYNNKQKYKRIE